MTDRTPASRPEKIHALTSLRFFAAFYVVLYHTIWAVAPQLSATSTLGHIISLGNVAVGFFFLLSGYILAIVYLKPGRGMDRRSFYLSRFARIYPLFFFTLVADTPNLFYARVLKYGWSSAIFKTTLTFVANVFMLQVWIPLTGGINDPNWSLAVETIFYLLFPVAGVWIWKMRRNALLSVSILLYCLSVPIIYLAAHMLPIDFIAKSALIHIPTFLLGILLARWQTMQRERKPQKVESRASLTALLGLALMGYILAVAYLSQMRLEPILNASLAPLFACLVWVFSSPNHPFRRTLNANWLVLLGEASFGLYLIHLPVYHLWLLLHWESNLWTYLLYLAVCIALSIFSFYFVETPSRKWILKRFKTKTKESMESASDAQ